MSWWRDERPGARRVSDGVKPRHKNFAAGWWAKRWMDALERFGWETRLTRGRSYARSGQVVSYEVGPGRVTAKVQGSRPKPYDVKIELTPLTEPVWKLVLDALAEQAAFGAALLAGDMPHDIEDAFRASGAHLLPASSSELKTQCSCPDFANPCKHIAALHYIVADALDDDPFVMFALRGRTRQQVLEALRERRGGAAAPAPAASEPVPEPVPADPAAFWGTLSLPEPFDVGLSAPRVRHSLLTRLGAPGRWTTADEFIEVLGPSLWRLSDRALTEADER
jgi:uncharacterized Zn finger protein